MSQEQLSNFSNSSIYPNVTIPNFDLNTSELTKIYKSIIDSTKRKLNLNQKGADSKPAEELANSILDTSLRIANICGIRTQTRPNIIRIAKILLENPNPIILAPSCPDFSHLNGKYNFESLSGGVPLLAQKQIEFIQSIKAIIPTCKPIILLADAEIDDEEMLNKVNINKDKFRKLINQSLIATEVICEPLGIKVKLMTDYIEDLREQELACCEIIKSKMSSRIKAETLTRQNMYIKINPNFTYNDMKQRTERTAAQYMALGQFATQTNSIISNHTTTNLAYYPLVGTALVHNSTEIY